jgi:hypothetical protein
VRHVSRRNRPPRTLTKAINLPATRGTTYSAEQVVAMVNALNSTGLAAKPLPRLQPMVPFGPGIPLNPAPINPLNPITGRAEPRQYEYPVTFNLPGFGDRLIPWKVLRDAGNLITLFRRCIEIRKAEVVTLDWDVTISAKAIERAQRQDPSAARSDVEKSMRERVEPHIARLVDFWECPDPRNGHDFIGWAGKVLEEYFVLDAISIYPRMRRNGDLFGFEVLDGTTIKPLLDADGFRPMAPNPAYQQILYGFPRGEFVADGPPDPDMSLTAQGFYPTDRLVYKVHNVRSFTPYGFSAVEQALSDGELLTRRMAWLKAEYTEGTMPAGWLKTSEMQGEWSPAMLREFETEFNDWFGGNTIRRQRHRILPPGMEPVETTDLNERFRPDYDLHLIKLVAGHFDTTIAELGFTETGGLGSTGWHEGQADVQDRKATQPTLRRLQSLCTQLMRTYLAAPPELEFRIIGLESEDADAADEVSDRRIKRGAMTLNEDRDRTGLPRYNFPEADMPMVDTGRGVVFLEGASKLAAPGVMIGPPQAPPLAGTPGELGDLPGQPQGATPGQAPAGGVAGKTPPPAGPKPSPDAVKAELAAYRRWVSKGRTGRPFQFTTITKAQADAADIDLPYALFKAEEVAGRAPKVRHWPGWERDLQVAEHWATRLLSAMTGVVSAAKLTSEAAAAFKRGGRDAVAKTIARHDWRGAILPSLKGLWTDGYVVGILSARAVLSHHGVVVKADVATVTLGVDWAGWTPGDEDAAKQILGREDALGHLLRLVDSGDTVADSIVVNRMDRLAGELIQGLERGDAPASIARQITSILGDSNWAHRVALTETTRAVSSATLLSYGRNGVDGKEWITALDQRVCALCSSNEDQGAIPIGAGFPSGDDAPPGHPLCRCSLSPAWLTAEEAAAQGVGPDMLTGLGEDELGTIVAREAEDILAEGEADEAALSPEAQAAMARQAAIDTARSAADIVTEFGELAGNLEGMTAAEAADLLSERLELAVQDAKSRLPRGERLPTPLANLRAAAKTRDVEKMRAAVNRFADRAGIERLEVAGQNTVYNPAVHQLMHGATAAAGEPMVVLRPGAAMTHDGERIVLERPLVGPTPVVTGDQDTWLEAHADTGWGRGLPVRDLVIRQGYGDYTIAEGWAFKVDGVGYVIETKPGLGEAAARRWAQDLERFQKTLPGDVAKYQKTYTVAQGRNPADPYWAQRYQKPNFRAAAMAQDGHTTQWDPVQHLRYDSDLRHEFGHSLSDAMRSQGLDAEGQVWQNATRGPNARGQVYDFTPRVGGRSATGNHAITLADDSSALFPTGVTRYGRSSIVEDYAESADMYMDGKLGTGRLTPGGPIQDITFADLFPARAKVLDRVFKTPGGPSVGGGIHAPIAVDPFAGRTVVQLRALAREQGLKGYSALRREQLVQLLQGGGKVEAQAAKDLSRMTVPQLRAEAKARGMTGYSKLTKPRLLDALREPTREPVAAREPVRVELPNAAAAPYHLQLSPEQAAIQQAVESGVARAEPLSGGNVAETELLTMNNGTVLVRKTVEGYGPHGDEFDGVAEEQAAAMIGNSLGIGPAVYRNSENEIYMQYFRSPSAMRVETDMYEAVDQSADIPTQAAGFKAASEAYKLREAAAIASDDGRKIGLLDQMITNSDRHTGNWLLDGDRPIPIDHGQAFGQSYNLVPRPTRGTTYGNKQFGSVYAANEAEFASHNPLTQADVAAVRERLAALAPDFAHIGKSQWLGYAQRVLDLIGQGASGTRNIIAGA